MTSLFLQESMSWLFIGEPFFVDSFVNSGWLKLMVFFHANEQDGEQNAFMVNFTENSNGDLRRGFK